MATVAAWRAARDVIANPADTVGLGKEARTAQYDYLWSYYANTAFENAAKWQSYRSQNGLYQFTRSIYNPVQRIVDFYVNHVYAGVLSEDGSQLPDGVPIAIPLAEDTDPGLKSAIAQFWQWSNWQDGSGLMVLYGAAAGNVLVEVVDEVDRGKISRNIVWPGLVDTDYLKLDDNDNVKAYAIEYEARESTDTTRTYTYRKEVDQEEFRYFKDGKPFDYGKGSSYPNPYTFVPAVWVKHRNQGGSFGMPAIAGAIPKIDELNSLASHINDQIHKVIKNVRLFTTDGDVVPLMIGASNTDKRPRLGANPLSGQLVDKRQSSDFLKAPPNTESKPLVGDLNLGDALPYLKELLSEIERDFPELTFYEQLRSMSTVTGPAAMRLTGDVGMKVARVQANYDQQSIKLFQMAVAIGGWRLNRRDWKQPTSQQMKFAPFDLTSYQRGNLDFSIMPRPLIAPNEAESVALSKARGEAVKARSQWIDEVQALKELKYSEKEQKEILGRREANTPDIQPSETPPIIPPEPQRVN